MEFKKDFERLVDEGKVTKTESQGETTFVIGMLKFVFTATRIEIIDHVLRFAYNYDPLTQEYTSQTDSWMHEWQPPKPIHWLKVKKHIIALLYNRLEMDER